MIRSLFQPTYVPAGVAAFAVIAFACCANADSITIYSDLTPPPSMYRSQSGFSVSGPGAGDSVVAAPFTAGASATVSNVVLALGHYGTKANDPITVALLSDSSGQPGTVLATLTQQGTIPPGNSSGGLVTFTCGTCTHLAGGTAYWLAAFQTTQNVDQFWYLSFFGGRGSVLYNYAGSLTGPWTSAPPNTITAFQVNGSSPAPTTPEPASVLLAAIGLIGLAVLRRKRLARCLVSVSS